MKITCDSCGAKYTIADDKVSGRKVKIRCKGCGTPIVVDGAQPNAAGANGASGRDNSAQEALSSPPEALTSEWSVNLSETDQRTMSTQQLVEGWANGSVTSDAYVWKEGMADWVPILESQELAPLLQAPKAAPASVRPASARPAATTSRGGAGRAQAGADLFAAAAAAEAAADEEASMAAPSFPQVNSQEEVRPTGARNENSVLFSLDALKAGFSGAAPSKNAPPSTPPPRGPAAGADDPFGLGSAGRAAAGPMFSLADNNALLTAPAPPEPPPKPAVAYAEPGGASIPAPGSKKGLIIGAIAVLVVGGVGAAFALSAQKDKEEALKAAAAAAASAEQAKEQAKEEERKARAAEERAREEQRAAEARAQAAPPATASEPSNKPEEASDPTKTVPEPSHVAQGVKKSEPKPKDTSPPAAHAGGDQPFSKAAAVAALGSAANNAGSCKKLGGPTGTGKVTVTFATSGRVTSANVSGGPFAGTSVGGCVASLFRRAKVPAFSGNPVTVSKSFTIN